MTPSHLMIAGGVVLGASLIPGLATTAKGYFKKATSPSEPLYTGLPAEPAPPGAVAYIETILAALPTESPEVVICTLAKGLSLYDAVKCAYTGGAQDE